MLLLLAHDRHALIWSSLPLPQDSSVCQPDKPWIFLPTSFWHSLVCGLFLSFIWLIPVLFLSLFVIQPTLISYRPTWSSAIVSQCYSFYIHLPLCLLLGYGLCTRPALNMYVYKCLVSAIGIPQTWNQLGSHHHLSSLQQPWGCSCWLLNHTLDLSTYCVFEALRRKLAQ